jgi:hypothetical protein
MAPPGRKQSAASGPAQDARTVLRRRQAIGILLIAAAILALALLRADWRAVFPPRWWR